MKRLTVGLFSNKQAAGEAVSELNAADYTDKISLIVKDENDGEVRAHQVKQNVSGSATVVGAATGAALGALGAILAVATPVVVAGVGALLVGGPISALIGAAVGGVTGALVAALVDLGLPEEQARMYQHRIFAGAVLVAVTTGVEDEQEVRAVLQKHGAEEVTSLHLHRD